jgi:hypothetical protein
MNRRGAASGLFGGIAQGANAMTDVYRRQMLDQSSAPPPGVLEQLLRILKIGQTDAPDRATPTASAVLPTDDGQ